MKPQGALAAEVAAFNELAAKTKQPLWKPESFKTVTIGATA